MYGQVTGVSITTALHLLDHFLQPYCRTDQLLHLATVCDMFAFCDGGFAVTSETSRTRKLVTGSNRK